MQRRYITLGRSRPATNVNGPHGGGGGKHPSQTRTTLKCCEYVTTAARNHRILVHVPVLWAITSYSKHSSLLKVLEFQKRCALWTSWSVSVALLFPSRSERKEGLSEFIAEFLHRNGFKLEPVEPKHDGLRHCATLTATVRYVC
jgi:hypothetical protein